MELLAQRDTFLEKHSGTPVSFNTIVNNQYAWQQCYEVKRVLDPNSRYK
jgi:hypothetical protein